MNAQLTELLTNYGDIGGIWFDGMWDKKGADWKLDNTYSLIHKLQPQTLIGSNHHLAPIPGEDFQMFEKDLPGKNTAGFNTTAIGKLPLESCETMNGSWGYNIKDTKFKSTKHLIHFLVKAAGNNANLLLNTGPQPDGKIQAENIKTLKEMGAWLKTYGETIYGTRGGSIGPYEWGVTTQKGNKVFVHILDAKDDVILLPGLIKKVRKAYDFSDNSKVIITKTKKGIIISVPEGEDVIDKVVVLEF